MNKQIKEALALEQQAQQFLSALKNEICLLYTSDAADEL